MLTTGIPPPYWVKACPGGYNVLVRCLPSAGFEAQATWIFEQIKYHRCPEAFECREEAGGVLLTYCQLEAAQRVRCTLDCIDEPSSATFLTPPGYNAWADDGRFKY